MDCNCTSNEQAGAAALPNLHTLHIHSLHPHHPSFTPADRAALELVHSNSITSLSARECHFKIGFEGQHLFDVEPAGPLPDGSLCSVSQDCNVGRFDQGCSRSVAELFLVLIVLGNVSSSKQSDTITMLIPRCCELGRPLENVQLGVGEARSCVGMRERGGEGAGRGKQDERNQT
jgi:hypothetical protein